MPAIKCILCPIDFSESSVLAFDYAQSVAAHYKALVLLQHVVDSLRPLYPYHAFPNDYDEICRKLRADAVQQLVEFAKTNNCCGVRTQYERARRRCNGPYSRSCRRKSGGLDRNGNPRVARGRPPDAGISHGKGVAKGRLSGADRAQAGSTILPPLQRCLHLVEVQRIVCCMDFSESSSQALEQAVSLAAEYGAELTLLHVIEHISSSSDIEKETTKALEGLEKQISPWAHQNLVTKPVVRIGKAYQQSHSACLGVTNRLGRHGWTRAACTGSCRVRFDDLQGGAVRPLSGAGGTPRQEA